VCNKKRNGGELRELLRQIEQCPRFDAIIMKTGRNLQAEVRPCKGHKDRKAWKPEEIHHWL
jgi:hypothetical protein